MKYHEQISSRRAEFPRQSILHKEPNIHVNIMTFAQLEHALRSPPTCLLGHFPTGKGSAATSGQKSSIVISPILPKALSSRMNAS